MLSSLTYSNDKQKGPGINGGTESVLPVSLYRKSESDSCRRDLRWQLIPYVCTENWKDPSADCTETDGLYFQTLRGGWPEALSVSDAEGKYTMTISSVQCR